MNKQQREYTIDRIQKIANGKNFVCECETPSLAKHIRRAIAAGLGRLKPAKEIIAACEEKVLTFSNYREDSIEFTCLFDVPATYREAIAAMEAEKKKHADANAEIQRFAQSLIDRVELGEFEDGKEPIRLMEAYAPKAPKK